MRTAGGRLLHLLWFLALIAALLFAAFGLYARHVMASPKMERLARASLSYPCVETVHDPKRPQDRPELQIARFYLQYHEPEIDPDLSWHVRFALAIAAVQWSSNRMQANRMFAALPMGSAGDFDAVGKRYSGKRFCDLDEPHKQAIRDFFASGQPAPLEEAFSHRPAA